MQSLIITEFLVRSVSRAVKRAAFALFLSEIHSQCDYRSESAQLFSESLL